MNSAAYRSQLEDPRYPPLASTFICCGMLDGACGNSVAAGYAQLHATWVLDDEGPAELAQEWRHKAADAFVALLVVEGSKPPPGVCEGIAIDCFRRAGRFPEAMKLIDQTSTEKHPEIIGQVLALQRKLIEQGDTRAHTIKEAVEAQ